MDVHAMLKTIVPALRPLFENGYVIPNQDVMDGSFYLFVPVRGRNWTVSFSMDEREKAVSCYLTRMPADGSKMVSLVEYLVDRCGVRGFSEGKLIGGYDPAEEVRHNIDLLEKHAPWIIKDLQEGACAPGGSTT